MGGEGSCGGFFSLFLFVGFFSLLYIIFTLKQIPVTECNTKYKCKKSESFERVFHIYRVFERIM